MDTPRTAADIEDRILGGPFDPEPVPAGIQESPHDTLSSGFHGLLNFDVHLHRGFRAAVHPRRNFFDGSVHAERDFEGHLPIIFKIDVADIAPPFWSHAAQGSEFFADAAAVRADHIPAHRRHSDTSRMKERVDQFALGDSPASRKWDHSNAVEFQIVGPGNVISNPVGKRPVNPSFDEALRQRIQPAQPLARNFRWCVPERSGIALEFDVIFNAPEYLFVAGPVLRKCLSQHALPDSAPRQPTEIDDHARRSAAVRFFKSEDAAHHFRDAARVIPDADHVFAVVPVPRNLPPCLRHPTDNRVHVEFAPALREMHLRPADRAVHPRRICQKRPDRFRRNSEKKLPEKVELLADCCFRPRVLLKKRVKFQSISMLGRWEDGRNPKTTKFLPADPRRGQTTMPELPDLVHIRNELEEELQGALVSGIEIYEPVVVRNHLGPDLHRALHGQSLKSVGRHGPFLRFDFGSALLIVHCMLAGRFLVVPNAGKRKKSALCVVLSFGETALCYYDDKKMGKVYFIAPDEEGKIPGFTTQGIDLLSSDFTESEFLRRIDKQRKQVRVFVMDQKILSAVGNAYADEILYDAQIHPKTFCSQLDVSEKKRLYESIRRVLADGIREVEAAGRPLDEKVRGHMKVRNRKDEPCPRCGTKIRRANVLGYDSFFCPSCQPAKRELFIDWNQKSKEDAE